MRPIRNSRERRALERDAQLQQMYESERRHRNKKLADMVGRSSYAERRQVCRDSRLRLNAMRREADELLDYMQEE